MHLRVLIALALLFPVALRGFFGLVGALLLGAVAWCAGAIRPGAGRGRCAAHRQPETAAASRSSSVAT
jgi:hypothetical protein